MLYNIKTLSLHCVFHGIRFKVNEDWVSAIDTLLFLYTYSSSRVAFLAQAARVFSSSRMAFHFFCPNKRNETKKIRRLHFLSYSGTFLR